MADISQLETALINADKAGDADAARTLAAEIVKMRAAPAIQAKPSAPLTESGYEDSVWQQVKNTAGDVSDAVSNIRGGAIRGAGSIGASLLYPVDKITDMVQGDRGQNLSSLVTGKQPISRNEERRQDMDHALRQMGFDTDSGTFKTGKIGTEIVGTLGVGGGLAKAAQAVGLPSVISSALGSAGFTTGANLPANATLGAKAADMGIRSLAGGVTGATAASMIDPKHAVTGGLFGAVLPPSVAGLGKVGSAITSGVGGKNRALADIAINKYGIPLGVGDIAEGATTKALRSVLNDAPITGSIGANQRKAVQEAYNKAVGGTFGANETKLTADVLDAAKGRMGAEFNRLWNQNALQVDGQMINKILDLQQRAAKLPKNDGASLNSELNDLMSKMTHDVNGNLVVSGETANAFQSYLRRRAESSAGLKNELGDLRQAVISAFNRGIGPADAAALTANRTAYKSFKTVEPLLNKSEVGVAGREAGDVPAALLPQAVAQSYQRAAGTPLADLSQIGSRFIVDRVPKTGGSARAMIQNSALGAALGAGALTNPMLAAGVIPAAMGTNKLLGSPALAEYLLRQGSSNALLPYLQFGGQAAPAILAR